MSLPFCGFVTCISSGILMVITFVRCFFNCHSRCRYVSCRVFLVFYVSLHLEINTLSSVHLVKVLLTRFSSLESWLVFQLGPSLYSLDMFHPLFGHLFSQSIWSISWFSMSRCLPDSWFFLCHWSVGFSLSFRLILPAVTKSCAKTASSVVYFYRRFALSLMWSILCGYSSVDVSSLWFAIVDPLWIFFSRFVFVMICHNYFLLSMRGELRVFAPLSFFG